MSAPGVGANEALAQAGALLGERLQAQRLGEPEINACAECLARFHREAPVAPADSGFASPVQRAAVAMAALQGAAPLCSARRDGRLLNAWLDATGEHPGLPGLRHALVYRALVRAQVARMRGRSAVAHCYVDAACTGYATRRTYDTLFALARMGCCRARRIP